MQVGHFSRLSLLSFWSFKSKTRHPCTPRAARQSLGIKHSNTNPYIKPP